MMVRRSSVINSILDGGSNEHAMLAVRFRFGHVIILPSYILRSGLCGHLARRERRTHGLGPPGGHVGSLAGGQCGLDGQDSRYGLGLARLGPLAGGDGRLHGGDGIGEPGVEGGGGGGRGRSVLQCGQRTTNIEPSGSGFWTSPGFGLTLLGHGLAGSDWLGKLSRDGRILGSKRERPNQSIVPTSPIQSHFV